MMDTDFPKASRESEYLGGFEDSYDNDLQNIPYLKPVELGDACISMWERLPRDKPLNRRDRKISNNLM